jgi:hypothetical protein
VSWPPKRTQVSTAVFAPTVGRDRGSTRHGFCRTRLGAEGCRRSRPGAARCRAPLLGAAGMSTPDAVRSFGARRCRGRKRPALPALRDRVNVIGHHRSNAGRNGPSASLLSVWHSSILPGPVIGTATLSRPHVPSASTADRWSPVLLRRRVLLLIHVAVRPQHPCAFAAAVALGANWRTCPRSELSYVHSGELRPVWSCPRGVARRKQQPW